MARTGDRGHTGVGTAALVCALAAGCFRDPGAGPLCEGAACLTGSTGVDTTGTSTTTPTTTGASETTAAPVDRSITLRISSMAFVDPHLFITEEGADTDTDTGADTDTGGGGSSCVNDVTMLVNGLLNSDLTEGKFNLLIRFEDFGVIDEVRLINGACDPPATEGAQWVCRPDNSPSVNLNTEIVDKPGCRNLEPDVYATKNLDLINDPGPPCLRTARGSMTLPVSDFVGSLDLREAQVVAMLDDTVAPSKLIDGVVYGFLPMPTAQNLKIDAPLFGIVDLWSVIEAPACVGIYPDYLPNVDELLINNMLVKGAWLAINFTAEQVDYRPEE